MLTRLNGINSKSRVSYFPPSFKRSRLLDSESNVYSRAIRKPKSEKMVVNLVTRLVKHRNNIPRRNAHLAY